MQQKTAPSIKRSRLKLILIFALFLGPLITSFVWYYGLDARFAPAAQSNYSVLVTPPLSFVDTDSSANGEIDGDGLSLPMLEGKWTFLHSLNGSCDAACQTALYNTRQVRQAVGKDIDRVQRVIIYNDVANLDDLKKNHLDARFVLPTTGDLTEQLKPTQIQYGNNNEDIYLVDPFGNVMMYIPPELEPRLFLKDIKKLLRLSQIG